MNETKEDMLAGKPGMGDFLVVGIGASAGGVEALQDFFANVPQDSGMAYVVVLHLSPDYESELSAILTRKTWMPVTQITEKTAVEKDHVYVVSPDRHLIMEDGYIAVSPNMQIEDRRAPVDIFFRSLAEHFHSRSVGVILSGTGANGSMGIKRIKERGGATFVQNPREAAYNEMPRNSIATNLIDAILPVAEIPARIVAYAQSIGTVRIAEDTTARPEDDQQALREIFTLMRMRTGHDFSNYKRPTLLRRIERRINVHDLASLSAYAEYLRQNAEESSALLKDLLISVTNFFRDRKAFDYIETSVLPRILMQKGANESVRIWVIGCATGEEAYSIAMLCAEKTVGVMDAPPIQVFATDIDENAIKTARDGLYTLNDAADVSPERLRRFFTREGDSYRIRREIRETVLFANHNVLKDPPFSHLDMVTCRNMMIYLNTVAQERVLETVHFALDPGGFLFLGTSESADGAADLYVPVSREHHIYQSRSVAPRSYPVPDSVPALNYSRQKETDNVPEAEVRANNLRMNYADLHQQLLEQYAPPSVVVNEEYDIVHVSERAGKYLQVSGGEPSKNLLKLVRGELRLELRTALYQATQRKANVEAKGLKVRTDDTTETLNLHVRPVVRDEDTARGFMLVVFERAPDEQQPEERIYTSDTPVAHHLEEELIRVKTQLRTTIEQHEIGAEELKASNEELQAMNEELRSAAEELETSKEELQSINEELSTVNQELKVKVEETSLSNNNFQNLINSTDIATVFLDRSFRINMFTPPARDIFNVIQADFGRPISDITNKLEYPNLLEDAELVLNKLTTIEREVQTTNGGIFLMRLLPYRTDEDRISGVVVTFINITERKKSEEARLRSETKYRTLFNSIDEGFHIMDMIYDNEGKPVDYRYHETNHSFERHTGLKNVEGRLGSEVTPGIEAYWLESYDKVVKTGEPLRFENYNEFTQRWYSAYAFPVPNESTTKVAVLFGDITERKHEEEKQNYLLQLSDALRNLSGSGSVQSAACHLLAEKLNASRVNYAEVVGDEYLVQNEYCAPGLVSMKGRFSIDSFRKSEITAFRNGETVVINNIAEQAQLSNEEIDAYTALQVAAFVSVPLVKNTNLIAVLSVIKPAPYVWKRNEVRLIEETAERTWAAVERARTEEALRKSEEKYRSLFESVDEGFAIQELVTDREGHVVDLIYREVNAVFEKHTGMKNALGKRVREFVPNLEPYWVDALTHVYETGEPLRQENYTADLDRWISYQYSRIGEMGSPLIAVVFNDITERKRSEQQQAFLLKFSDTLREEQTADAVANRSLEMLIEYLRLDRSYIVSYHLDKNIASLDYQIGNETVPPLPDTLDLSQYPEAYKTIFHQTLVIEDDFERHGLSEAEKQNSARLGMRAMVAATVRKGENRPLWSIAAVNSTPRRWRPDEIKLLEEIAERTWTAIETAKSEQALRESEEKYRTLFDSIDEGFTICEVIFDKDDKPVDILYLDANPAALRLAGRDFTGLRMREIDPNYEDYWYEVYGRVALTGESARDEHYAEPHGRWFDFYAFKVGGQASRRVASVFQDTTERKIAEEALRQSQELFESIANLVPDLLWDSEPDGSTNWYNRRWLEYTGQSFEEAIKWGWVDAIHPEDRESSARRYEKAVKEGTPLQQEHRIQRYDGEYRWFVVNVLPFKDETGHVVKMYGAATDIHDRKGAEEAVRLRERELARVQEIGNIGGVDVSVRDNLNGERSPEYRKLHGLLPSVTRETHEDWKARVHPDDRDKAEQALFDALTGDGNSYENEYRIIRPNDGQTRWIYAKLDIERDDNGIVQRLVGVHIDITARKEAEEALSYSETRLRIVAKSSGIGTWIRYLEEDRIETDEKTDQLFGLPLQNYTLVETVRLLVHPDDISSFTDAFEIAVDPTSAGVLNTEFRIIRPDGAVRWLHNVGQTFFDGEPKHPVMMVGSTVDITERKVAEQILRENEERLRLTTEAARIYAWEYDLENDRYSYSANAASILGLSPGDLPLTAKHTFSIVHPDDRQTLQATMEKAASTGEGFSLDIRSLKSDKQTIWLSVQATVMKDGHGTPLRVIGIAQDVSERKLSEEALRESEERHRAFFHQSTAGVYETDVDGNIKTANETFSRSLLYKEAEVLKKNVRDITHPDDVERCFSLLKEAVKTGHSFTTEKRLLRSDGSCIWVTETISGLRDKNGNITSVLSVGIEITDRKRTEMFIHESEERYRIALEAGELATWDWNLKTDSIIWNEQHFSLFGVAHEDETISPEFFLGFVYPEDIALVKQQLAEVLGEKGLYSAEFRIRRHDNGKLRWMTGYGRVTDREDGKPVRVSGVMFDSTERREAEDNLTATKNSLSTALEAAKMGVWTIDMTHGYMDRSNKHDQLLGYTNWQESWSPAKAKANMLDEDKPKYDEAYENLFENGVFDLQARVRNTDGSVCWIHYFGRTFRNEDGKGETAAGVIFDITDQKTIEKQKDDFIGIASHELKTPVTSIKAYAEILQEMFIEANDKRSADLMGKLDSQVDRLTKLIKDLLDVTKVSEGQLELIKNPFDMEALIRNTREEMQRTTRSHTIQLSIQSLPQVTGDEERIAQVLVNMMSNAIKYSPDAKEVLVEAKYENGNVNVSVQDFGIGMSPGTMEKLFARFFRSDNPSVRSFPGLGLGLFISMEIMKRHGGTIAVQSERGKGSIFTMILPVT